MCFVHWLPTVICLEIDTLCFLIHIHQSAVSAFFVHREQI